MNLSQVTTEVRRNQGLKLRLLSDAKAERIIEIAIGYLPDRPGVLNRRACCETVWSRYRAKYGFDPLVWLVLWQLVKLLINWWLLSSFNRLVVSDLRRRRNG